MSFDLWLWGSPKPVTLQQAERICGQLSAGEGADREADPQLEGFYRQLIAWYPPLERLSDSESEGSPWSMSPGLAPGHVTVMVRWPSAQEITRRVIPLAAEHSLVCYDPQAGHVHNPPHQGSETRLEFCDGSVILDPEPTDLRRLLRLVDTRNWYAVLEREPGWYVQVGIGQHAGRVPAGTFALEYREGAADRHFRTLVTSLDEVVSAFGGFASADPAWRSAFAWQQLSL